MMDAKILEYLIFEFAGARPANLINSAEKKNP